MSVEKILLIAPPSNGRDSLAALIRPKGYEVFTAESGNEGLRLMLRSRPDLILISTQLADKTAGDFVHVLRQAAVNIPVIFLLATSSVESMRESLRAGAADIICLPADADDVFQAISNTLTQARLQAELTAANSGLRRREQELRTIVQVGRQVTSVLNLDKVLARVAEAAISLTDAEESLLLLRDERTQELFLRASKNMDETVARTFRVPADDSLAGKVIRTGEALLLDRDTPHAIATSYLVFSLLYVPIRTGRGVIGVLGVYRRRARRAFTPHDRELLEALGDFAAIAIENAHLFASTETERARLDAVLNETVDGVLVLDTEHRVLLVNPTARAALKLTGVPMNTDIFDVVASEDLKALVRGEQVKTEIVLTDGRVFNAHITPITGVGSVVTMQDITHLKQLDRLKSDFVSIVSHDLRSPLTAILGYSELVGRVGPVNPTQADLLQKLQGSVQAINELITDLLDLGKIEAGLDKSADRSALKVVLDYVLANGAQIRLEDRLQVLDLSVPSNLPLLRANAARLRQVCANLLENAIKYTPVGGKITVEAHAEGDFAIIQFRDNGIGIPPADQPYIFSKFYRATNARGDFEGTGLGLSIVKSIVEQHRGRIWMESQQNEGTTFTVMWPIHKDTL